MALSFGVEVVQVGQAVPLSSSLPIIQDTEKQFQTMSHMREAAKVLGVDDHA